MAAKKPKVDSRSAQEKAAEAAVKAFAKSNEGKELTDQQKAKKKELHNAHAALKFVRIANKRLPKALAAINGLANLNGAGYVVHGDRKLRDLQVKAICESLEAALKDLRQKLAGTKQSAPVFSLPTTIDA